MYNVKDVIDKMKKILNINSNIELANFLKVSYNTLNTWIKRGKIPQEVIYDFCQKQNCSFDYLLTNKNELTIISGEKEKDINSEITFKYYAFYDDLDIPFGATLYLSPTLTISNGIYLLKDKDIYLLAKCKIDIFNNKVTITEKEKIIATIDIDKFNKIKVGLLIKFDTK